MTPSTSDPSPNIILNDDDIDNYLPLVYKTITEKLFYIWLTSRPFGSSVTINIKAQGIHPTLGSDIRCDTDTNWIILSQHISGTPAHLISI